MADIYNVITQGFTNGEVLNEVLLGGQADVLATIGAILKDLPEAAADCYVGSFGEFLPGDVYALTKEASSGVYFKGGYTQLSGNRHSVFAAWDRNGSEVTAPSFLKEAVNLKEFEGGFSEILSHLRVPASSKARGKTPVQYHKLLVVFQGHLVTENKGMSYFKVTAALVWDMNKIAANNRSALTALVSGGSRFTVRPTIITLPEGEADAYEGNMPQLLSSDELSAAEAMSFA